MYLLLRKVKPTVEAIIIRIKLLDELPHVDIYSRWEADKQIAELTRQLKELNQ